MESAILQASDYYVNEAIQSGSSEKKQVLE